MEQDEFLKDLQTNNDVFDQPLNPQPEAGKPKEDEEEEIPKNRTEKRLRSKLQAERETSIALAARLEALTEAKKFSEGTDESDYLRTVEKIYGTQSPEATAATELLKKALQDVEKTATEKALKTYREEQAREKESLANEEKELDSMVEEIEDEYGISMDANTKKGFFTLLEKLSPKDRDGNVTEYADHNAVWEELQARKERLPNNSRAKDLASRSMTRTGASPSTGVEVDSNERWLRDNGII